MKKLSVLILSLLMCLNTTMVPVMAEDGLEEPVITSNEETEEVDLATLLEEISLINIEEIKEEDIETIGEKITKIEEIINSLDEESLLLYDLEHYYEIKEYIDNNNQEEIIEEQPIIEDNETNNDEIINNEDVSQEENNNTNDTYVIPPLNYITPEYDEEKIIHKPIKRNLLQATTSLPTSYSSVSKGFVTPVKVQNPYGTCWAFAAIASAEGSLLKKNIGLKNTLDLSEMQLAWFAYSNVGVADPLNLITNDGTSVKKNVGEDSTKNGTDEDHILNVGGNSDLATFALASGIGLVNEDKVPYVEDYLDGTDFVIPSNNLCYTSDYILRSSEKISMSEIDLVKRAIMDHGAVAVSYFHTSDINNDPLYYGNNDASFYSGDVYQANTNHAVTIVGWNNSYSKDNFLGKEGRKPRNNGAWLVKNSWGKFFGNDGYFWMSYEEPTLENDFATVFNVEPVDSNNSLHLYQYDGGSYYDSVGYDEPLISAANIYTAQRDELLTDVGVFCENSQVNYEIDIYTNIEFDDQNSGIEPTNGTLAYYQEGVIDNAGYYLIHLDSPVYINNGDNFSIVVTYEDQIGDPINYLIDRNGTYNNSYYYVNDTSNERSYIGYPGYLFERVDNDPQDPYTMRIKGICKEWPGDVPTYKVEHYYENENGEYVAVKIETKQARVGTTVTAVKDALDKSYYIFSSNNPLNVLSGIVKDDNSLVLKVYYERTKYNITYNTLGGSTIGSIGYKWGQPVVAPENPSKNGYTFAGWDPELPEIMPQENLTVTAKWNIIPEEYWSNLNRSATVIDIPEGITDIPSNAFDGCSNLTTVKIPSSVSSIEAIAFSKCPKISVITVNSNNETFYSQNNAVITREEKSLIVGCKSTTIIPDGVYIIGGSAFQNCTGLTSITIPNSVVEIQAYAFSGSGLTSVIIPDSVYIIERAAFEYCNSLQYAKVPGLYFIEDSVFARCKNLKEVEFSSTSPIQTQSLGNRTFNKCSSLTTITLPDSLAYIGEYAFAGCISLESITIPSSVTKIKDSAFEFCIKLSSIDIPSSVTSIGENAFYTCSCLTSITIPSSVTSIGDDAFACCKRIESITIDPANTVYSSSDNANAIIEKDTNTLILGCKNTVIPSFVTSIGSRAFADCIGLESIKIPSSVTSIEDYAFGNCAELKSIYIPSSITTIGDLPYNGYLPFSGCYFLDIYTDATSKPAQWSSDWNKVEYGDLSAYVYWGVSSSEFDEKVNNGNVQSIPLDLKVDFDSNGNIAISTQNTDYIDALVSGAGYIDLFDGSFASENATPVIDIYNFQRITRIVLNGKVTKVDDTNAYVDCSNVDLSGIVSNNKTVISVGIKGFEKSYSKCKDIISIKTDTSGNIVITSDDTSWISAFVNSGSIVLKDLDSGCSRALYSYEYDFAISNGGKTTTIKNSQLVDAGIPKGTYQVILHANGGKYYYYPLNLNKGAKSIDLNSIDISYDETNQTISIQSNNTDFISKLFAINEDRSSGDIYSTVKGGYVKFEHVGDPNVSSDNVSYTFKNYDEYIGKEKFSVSCYRDFVISSDKKTLTITKDAINSSELVKGLDYTITIHAKGYATVETTVNSINVGVANHPNDINIEYVADKGVVITSNNTEWIDGIVYEAYRGGFVNLIKNPTSFSGGGFFTNNLDTYHGYGSIEKENATTVVVPVNAIYEAEISSGNFKARIGSYGFTEFYGPNDGFDLTGLKTIDASNITFNQDVNKLVIESTKADFISGLTDDHSYLSVYTTDENSEKLFDNYESQILFNDDGKAYMDYSKYKNALAELSSINDTGHITIKSFGYEPVTIDYNLRLIDFPGREIIVGAEKTLSLTNLEGGTGEITWNSSKPDIATISSEGKLKGIEAGTTTITATYVEDSKVLYYDTVDVTVKSNSKISLKIRTEDNNTIANVGVPEQLVVTATGYTLNTDDVIEYSTDISNIAEVSENGLITFKKPGIVTIFATSIGKTASIKLSVYSIDKSKKLTASYDGEILEVGKEVDDKITVLAGGDGLPNGAELVYTSSKDSIVSVDETGKLTANDKGTATITAALKDDPAKRKATCKVTVIDRIIDSISKDLNVEDNPAIVHNKSIDPVTDADTRLVHINYGLLDKNNKLHINIIDSGHGEDTTISPEYVTPAKVTYKSNNTSVATVDSKGFITFKKAGLVTITVTIASNPKGYDVVSKDIKFEAVDYTPRIETNKFVLEKYNDYNINEYPEYNLHKILSTDSNLITDCKITETNGNPSQYFLLDHQGENGNIDTFKVLFIERENTPVKSFTQLLQFSIDDGNTWYKYKVTVQVKATVPSVTPKVTGFYNTFTGENTLELVNTVKNGTIDTIEFVDDWATYDSSTGRIAISTYDAKGKPVTSGKVKYTFVGSSAVVEKTIKLSTKATKPTVKLETSTYTLYTPVGTTGCKNIEIKLIDNNKNVIKEGTVTLNDSSSIANLVLDDDNFGDKGSLKVSIPIENLKSGKIVLDYKGNDNWGSTIPLTINIKTAVTLPKAKLSKTSIKLNTNFLTTDTVEITLPGSSERISNAGITVSPNSGLEYEYENGKIKLKANTIGNYKVTCTPLTANGVLNPVTLTVKVDDDTPKAKLKTSTIKFNKSYSETIPVTLNITSNPYNATLTNLEVTDPNGYGYVEGAYIEGVLKVKLTDTGKAANPGNYKFTVTPTYTGGKKGQSLTLTVNIYDKEAKITSSLKSAINPLDKNSSSLINLKLSNIVGEVTDIEFVESNNLFEIDSANLTLKVKESAEWENTKDQTIKKDVIVKTDSCPNGITTTLSIKVARKAPKVTLSKSTINVYDITLSENAVLGEVDLNFDEGFKVINVVIPDNSAYKVEYNYDLSKFVVKMRDGSSIKANSSTLFTIKLIWKNDFINNGKYTKTSSIKLNVKDASSFIKTVK